MSDKEVVVVRNSFVTICCSVQNKYKWNVKEFLSKIRWKVQWQSLACNVSRNQDANHFYLTMKLVCILLLVTLLYANLVLISANTPQNVGITTQGSLIYILKVICLHGRTGRYQFQK